MSASVQRGVPCKEGNAMKAKHNLRTSLFCSALFLSMEAASAEDFDRCSTAKGAGRWGYTVTGTNTTGDPMPLSGQAPCTQGAMSN